MSGWPELLTWDYVIQVLKDLIAIVGAAVTLYAAIKALRHFYSEWHNRRQFDDMRALCEGRVGRAIKYFAPAVLFAFDGRGGVWAQIVSEDMSPAPKVVVGIRLKSEGPRHDTKIFDNYERVRLHVRGWDLLVPKDLLAAYRQKKILLVDDYVDSGATQKEFVDFLVEKHNWSRDNVRTFSVFAKSNARFKPDFIATTVPSLPELPYMTPR
jgi:hypoxanthine phosphoribosyltransferase